MYQKKMNEGEKGEGQYYGAWGAGGVQGRERAFGEPIAEHFWCGHACY
jgi:hypothetical protein